MNFLHSACGKDFGSCSVCLFQTTIPEKKIIINNESSIPFPSFCSHGRGRRNWRSWWRRWRWSKSFSSNRRQDARRRHHESRSRGGLFRRNKLLAKSRNFHVLFQAKFFQLVFCRVAEDFDNALAKFLFQLKEKHSPIFNKALSSFQHKPCESTLLRSLLLDCLPWD